jgi:predicted RNA-binding protein YlxR (DUF448 family)
LRFVAHDGRLVLGPSDPGRGVYTCPRLACFERARSRNAFNRTLRKSVRVDRELFRLFREPLQSGRGSTLTADNG